MKDTKWLDELFMSAGSPGKDEDEASAQLQQQILQKIDKDYVLKSEVLEAIGDYVVEDPRNIPEGRDVAYDYGVCRRAGANKLRKELRAKLNLEGR